MRRLGPDHLAAELAVHILPLRQHHLMRVLQAVMPRIGGELDAAEEGRDVGCVERRRHFFRIDRAGLLDRVLQDHAARVARSRVIVRLGVEFVLERLGEFRRGRPELRLVGDLQLPLRRHGDAERGGSELAEFIVGRRHQDRYPLHVGLLVVHLARQRGAVRIMAAAHERVGVRRNDLVDDRAEIRGGRRVGFVHHDVEPGLFGLLLRPRPARPSRTDRRNRPSRSWRADPSAFSASTAPER